MKYTCPFCNFSITAEYHQIVHSGFNNSGFMYCDKSGDILTWSTFDSNYRTIVDKHPWSLTQDEKQKVEDAVITCTCGGRFRFSAKPRCPNCNNEVPAILPDDIHFVVLKGRINGEKKDAKIWKQKQSLLEKSTVDYSSPPLLCFLNLELGRKILWF